MKGGGQCLPLLRPIKCSVQRVEQISAWRRGVRKSTVRFNENLRFCMSSLCDPHQACLPRLSLKVHEHCIASSCPSLRVHEHCIASSCRSLRVHERLYCLLVYPWECLNHMIDIEIALIHTWGCMNHGIVSALSIHEGAWAITLLPCPSLRLLDPYGLT